MNKITDTKTWEKFTELTENIFMGGCLVNTEYDKLGVKNAKEAIGELKELFKKTIASQLEEVAEGVEKMKILHKDKPDTFCSKCKTTNDYCEECAYNQALDDVLSYLKGEMK